MARAQIQTLVSITGQGEDDVVAMLKKYAGDVNAATNALMDSACPAAPASRALRRRAATRDRSDRPLEKQSTTPARGNAISPSPRRALTPSPLSRRAVEKFEEVSKKGAKKPAVRALEALPRADFPARDRAPRPLLLPRDRPILVAVVPTRAD